MVQSGSQAVLDSITILSLPDPGSGVLTMGGQPLEEGATVERSALGGLRFQSAQAPTETTVSFTFSPVFSGSGSAGQDPVTVTLYLLTQANRAPEARSMDLFSALCRMWPSPAISDAADPEGDPLTFQISDSPARGGVTLAEDGSGRLVYTPYENKTGRDSFTYVALDQAGNASAPATVTLRIEKAGTKVRYADMDGDPAHKAALRLAETGVYVGQQVDSRYFFQPDATVSRAQFLHHGHGCRGTGTPGSGLPHRLCRRSGHPHLGQGLRIRRIEGRRDSGRAGCLWRTGVPGGGSCHYGGGHRDLRPPAERG